MDAVIVGIVTGVAAVAGLQFWRLLVRPDDLLGDTAPDPEGWRRMRAGTVLALRMLGAGLVFVLGFLTGMLVVILPLAASP